MLYLLYLIGLTGLLTVVMTFRTNLLPAFSISIRFSELINFFDPWTLVLILAFCLLALVCTGSLRSLKNAMVFMFRKRELSLEEGENCLLAVKTAVLAALCGGGVSFIAGIVNMLKSMELSSRVSPLGTYASTALLSLAYALVICLILLPVYLSLKRELLRKSSGEKSQYIIAVHKNKKAG